MMQGFFYIFNIISIKKKRVIPHKSVNIYILTPFKKKGGYNIKLIYYENRSANRN
jgi:hypothetical protein